MKLTPLAENDEHVSVFNEDLEVLRRDVSCDLERDVVSELKTRERRPNNLPHLDTRPGELLHCWNL